MSRETGVAVVGLGSNLGSRAGFVHAALKLLAAEPDCGLAATSPLYWTAPVGPAQPQFINAAARVVTSLRPEALVDKLLELEQRLGRVRSARWGPRTIDLDLLWMEGSPVQTSRATVPHPELTRRAFALKPLLDVAPERKEELFEACRALGPEMEELQQLSLDEAVCGSGHGDGRYWTKAWGIDAQDALAAACSASGGLHRAATSDTNLAVRAGRAACRDAADVGRVLIEEVGSQISWFALSQVALHHDQASLAWYALAAPDAPAPHRKWVRAVELRGCPPSVECRLLVDAAPT